jgi:hypothetical protein
MFARSMHAQPSRDHCARSFGERNLILTYANMFAIPYRGWVAQSNQIWRLSPGFLALWERALSCWISCVSIDWKLYCHLLTWIAPIRMNVIDVSNSCEHFGTNIEIVGLGTRNRYYKHLNESPVAKYCSVISSFVAVGIAILILMSCFLIIPSINCNKASNRAPPNLNISVGYRIFNLQLFE